jgi:arabinoxylan arabinofuranohydrolase
MSARNPVLPPDIWIPDGEAHVMPDGRLFVYGSEDRDENIFCSTQYRAVSTMDLEEWTVHDKSFELEQVPWAGKPNKGLVPTLGRWTKARFMLKTGRQTQKSGRWPAFQRMMAAGRDNKGPFLFAPDGLEKDGRYYLYFCLSDGSEGVAVSDYPEGPFADAVQLPATGIDPSVFTDDDGSTYFYWGQFRASGVKLHTDLMGFDTGEVQHNLVTEEEHHFHEGSSVRKIDGTYYFVFADTSRGKPTSLGYATGPSPLGPFTYRGIIIDNEECDPNSWNIHGSIERFKDSWYVFYHRSSSNSPVRRRLCVEKINIGLAGRIAEVPMTSQGVGAPYAPGERIDGWRSCAVSGGAFVGSRNIGEERLILPSSGSSGTFRYVQSEQGFTSVTLDAEGEGLVQIIVGSNPVAELSLGGGIQEATFAPTVPGRHEVVIRMLEGTDVRVSAITLN